MSNNIAVALKTCKHRCHTLEGYVNMKKIKFGAEMGYKKCVVCECHFLFLGERTNSPLYCGCCNTKLRVKNPRRTASTKQKAKEFYINNCC